MKTNTNRIHKNGATKPANVQAKINKDVVNLIVSDPATGKQFVNRNIPKAIFAKALAVGKKEQIGVGGLIELNLRQLVQESNSPHENFDLLKARCFADDISKATHKADALMELIANHLDYRLHRSGTDYNADWVDRLNYGLELLMKEVRYDLKESNSNVMQLAYGKTPEVAS